MRSRTCARRGNGVTAAVVVRHVAHVICSNVDVRLIYPKEK